MQLQSRQYYLTTYPNIYTTAKESVIQAVATTQQTMNIQQKVLELGLHCPYEYPKQNRDITTEHEQAMVWKYGYDDGIITVLLQNRITAHGTGHRPSRFIECELVIAKDAYEPFSHFNLQLFQRTQHLVDFLLIQGVRGFITGGALGFDQTLEHILCAIRSQSSHIARCKDVSKVINTSDIVHIIAVPCAHQEIKWIKKAQAIYKDLLTKCSYAYYVDKRPYTHTCMLDRDQWMVNHSTITATAFMRNLRQGGTYKTIQMARKHDNKIYGFDPSQNWTSFSE